LAKKQSGRTAWPARSLPKIPISARGRIMKEALYESGGFVVQIFGAETVEAARRGA
jgi:hypothetical protein